LGVEQTQIETKSLKYFKNALAISIFVDVTKEYET